MKSKTKQRKKSIKGFEKVFERDILADRMFQIFSQGKRGLDALMLDLGRMVSEAIMYIEREEIADAA